MAGSSYFRRTQDVVTVDQSAGTELQIAISYEDLGSGQVEVTICRDGVQLGQYTDSPMVSWDSDAEILFGVRHTYSLTNTRGGLNATIEEARIYDGVLSCTELGELSTDVDSDGDGFFDSEDSCPDSAYDLSSVVDDDGCSIDDYCPCDDGWSNHGEYVSCVSAMTNDFKSDGLISGKDKGSIQSEAGRSECGK